MTVAPALAREHNKLSRLTKVAVDRIVALVALILLAPVFAAIAIWIARDSGRPIMFVQARAGRYGQPFSMFKFRTMIPDAVRVGRELKLSDDPFGIVEDDPRITRCGRFLRRTSLDELPQLLNVVRGEMSLVGPRPDLVEQAANYSESDRLRLTVLPGITGWSQVQGRDEIPWPLRISHDAWYIHHWSLRLDCLIVFKTFGQFFRAEPVPMEDTMNIERARQSDGTPPSYDSEGRAPHERRFASDRDSELVTSDAARSTDQ